MTPSPRELTFVFQTAEGVLTFHLWTRSYFAGAIAGAGSQLLPGLRVKLQGLYAGEPIMFAREAGKLGGVIELQPQLQGDAVSPARTNQESLRSS
jgi:hypothetical protein